MTELAEKICTRRNGETEANGEEVRVALPANGRQPGDERGGGRKQRRMLCPRCLRPTATLVTRPRSARRDPIDLNALVVRSCSAAVRC